MTHIKPTMEANETRKPRHPAILYLSEYRAKVKRIEALKAALEHTREMATNVSVRADTDRVSGSKARDSMANQAICAVDVERRIKTTIRHLQECLDMRLFLIEQIDTGNPQEDENEKLVLTYRYINCLPWREIQKKMHYEAAPVYRLHGRALQSFWKVYQTQQTKDDSKR